MITTNVLDTSIGAAAVGVTMRQASEWVPVGRGMTDGKGRTTLTEGRTLSPGHHIPLLLSPFGYSLYKEG